MGGGVKNRKLMWKCHLKSDRTNIPVYIDKNLVTKKHLHVGSGSLIVVLDFYISVHSSRTKCSRFPLYNIGLESQHMKHHPENGLLNIVQPKM